MIVITLIEYGQTAIYNFHYLIAMKHDVHASSVVSSSGIVVIERNVEYIPGAGVHPRKARFEHTLHISSPNELASAVLVGVNIKVV